jgi:hypothetical protein
MIASPVKHQDQIGLARAGRPKWSGLRVADSNLPTLAFRRFAEKFSANRKLAVQFSQNSIAPDIPSGRLPYRQFPEKSCYAMPLRFLLDPNTLVIFDFISCASDINLIEDL